MIDISIVILQNLGFSMCESVGDGIFCNDYGGRLVYLRGYRDGSTEYRLKLLGSGISKLV